MTKIKKDTDGILTFLCRQAIKPGKVTNVALNDDRATFITKKAKYRFTDLSKSQHQKINNVICKRGFCA